MARKLRPPSPIAVQPFVVSQLNVEAGAGLKPWRYLQFVTEENLPHRRLGKLVLVEASVLLEALRAERPAANGGLAEPITADSEADRILATIGRRRAS